MNRNLLIVGGVLVAVLVVGFVLIQGKPASGPAVSKNQVSQTTAPGTPNANAKQFTVTATEFAFSPSTINVKKGDAVSITFQNNGTFSHNLTIGDLNLATKTVSPGDSDTLEFTADKSGSFSYYCTVDSHKDKGMIGTLVVQ